MDFAGVANYIPALLVAAVVMAVVLTEISKKAVSKIEAAVEKKAGKQVKLFDHKKIWLSFIWVAVLTAALVLMGEINLKAAPFYGFMILGLSTFLYEAIVRRLKAWGGK